MEIRKIIVSLSCILLANTCFGGIIYNSIPVTIRLKKSGDDFAIQFQGRDTTNYPVFKQFVATGLIPGFRAASVETQTGTYGPLTEEFIKGDTFTFDSTKFGQNKSYENTINQLTDAAILAQQSRFSWTNQLQFIQNEKSRLNQKILDLYNYLKDNVFNYILTDIDQFKVQAQPQPPQSPTQAQAQAQTVVIIHPPAGTQSPQQVQQQQQQQASLSSNANTALTIDLYGETPINQSWRHVYWQIQKFCKELGVSTPSSSAWISTSGIKTGLWYTALAGGSALALYAAYLGFKHPGTIASALRSGAERLQPIAAETARTTQEAIKGAYQKGLEVGTKTVTQKATEEAFAAGAKAAQEAGALAAQEFIKIIP